jgi:1-deoxy-D-xylulose-5-phosphate reductoisomerase
MTSRQFTHSPLIPTSGLRSNPPGAFEPTRLLIQGSTGSIGRSALEIVRAHPERFSVVGLCGGGNVELLAEQALEFRPSVVCCRDEAGQTHLRKALPASIEVHAGDVALRELARIEGYDLLLAAVVGVAGLRPVVAALEAGKRVALANKESLVSGGRFVADALRKGAGALLPVDSEHSALFQALQGEQLADLNTLILTASGGPFLRADPNQLGVITPQQAVRHPRWNMGAKISIDSATLMNKGLELIEAHWLFGIQQQHIEVVVHPQSIVHSLVRFVDGSEIAQLSVPDMKGAIGYAFSYPHGRLPRLMPQLSLAEVGSLEFMPLDSARFPAVNLARQALDQGGAASAVLNLGNEIAVELFMQGRIKFTQIVPYAEHALARYGANTVTSLEGLCELLVEVRSGTEDLARSFS